MADAASSDEQLVAAYQAGNALALQWLLDRHLKAAWNLAYQLVLTPHVADDLTQEACLRAIRGLSSFRGQSAFRTWLFRIVINASRDLFADSSTKPAEVGGDGFDPPARRHERPEQVAMQVELEQEMTRALQALPVHLRTAIVLTTLHGLTPDEAADIEGCKTSTIYWRIHEARKSLRKHLEPWTT